MNRSYCSGIRNRSKRSGFTLLEVMVASAITGLVLAAISSTFLITARSIQETYGQTSTRSLRMRALDQIRYRLVEASQGVDNLVITENGTEADTGHRIEFKDPNLSGVTSAFWFSETANPNTGEQADTLYYDDDIDNNPGPQVVGQGPIDITFTHGDGTSAGSIVILAVKTLAPMSYSDVDLQDGETVIYARNPESSTP